ncbi:hypothetical protein [Conexibacter sp. DBS9H8]|uniref:hypothetical protein n=1 Tax=Conexibacter sp. DBS9H8 TaxID=2937801 RepID=UPI00200F30D6|nr:hypothetical protein [Conexibacter sp. DBS9H8]
MDRTDLVRLRWRLTGAWLWPTFVLLCAVDAVVGHLLPPSGDSESAVGGLLTAGGLMLLAIAFLSSPLGLVMRRVRRDLPRSVARNYAGTAAAFGVSVALALVGLIHHDQVIADRAAVQDATERAEAWIGAHAPPRFLTDLHRIDTVGIQVPRLYRSCVSDQLGTSFYCVVVDRSKPFGTGVSYSGHESNQLLEQGAY